MNGGDLYENFFKLKQFSEYQTQFYAAQIICGIQFLHKNKIIHRYLFLFYLNFHIKLSFKCLYI